MGYKPVDLHDKLMKKVIANSESRAEYDAFSLQLELADQLKKFRKKANMTQEQVADRMHTYKPTVSRIESATSSTKHSPSVLTLFKYADAVGCTLKIILTPKSKKIAAKK